jgi:hypothetical protein
MIMDDNFYNSGITGISFAEGGIDAPLFIAKGAFAGATELTGNVRLPSYLWQINGDSTFFGTQITGVSFEPGDLRGAIIGNDTFGAVPTLAGDIWYPINISGVYSAFYGTGITDVYLWHTSGADTSPGSSYNRPITGAMQGVSPSTWPTGTIVHTMCSAFPSFYNDQSGFDEDKTTPDGRWRSFLLATTSDVYFDNNGHGIAYPDPVAVGCDELLDEPHQHDDEYLFLGWFTEPADGERIDFDTFMPLHGDMMIGGEDTALYAQWVPADQGCPEGYIQIGDECVPIRLPDGPAPGRPIPGVPDSGSTGVLGTVTNERLPAVFLTVAGLAADVFVARRVRRRG